MASPIHIPPAKFFADSELKLMAELSSIAVGTVKDSKDFH
jgi:hypothetical protein